MQVKSIRIVKMSRLIFKSNINNYLLIMLLEVQVQVYMQITYIFFTGFYADIICIV